MDGIENITARIVADTEVEVGQILLEAQKRAEEVRKAYSEKVAAQKTAAEGIAQEAARDRLDQLERMAQMEARSDLLAAKQACLDKAFSQTLEAMQVLPEKEYTQLLVDIARKARRTGEEEIILNSADHRNVGAQVAKKAGLRLSDEKRPIAGGLILRSGNVEINCSFETQISILRESMATEVVGILLG